MARTKRQADYKELREKALARLVQCESEIRRSITGFSLFTIPNEDAGTMSKFAHGTECPHLQASKPTEAVKRLLKAIKPTRTLKP